MGWTSAEPENSSDHWTNALQACALQAPHMWPPVPCQVKSRTPEFCQHTCRTSRLLSCPFSGWITGFSDRGRKIQTQTYNHCDKLEFLKLYSHDCSHVRLYFKLNSKNQHASNRSSYLSEKEVRHCLLKWHITISQNDTGPASYACSLVRFKKTSQFWFQHLHLVLF